MARKFRQGDLVTQVMPAPITGTVVGFSLDQIEGEVHVIVEWEDADGVHQRDFDEAQLDVVPVV